MHAVHFLSRRRFLGALPLIAALLLAVLLLRFPSRASRPSVPDDAARIAYLESLGWQIDPQPIESLRLCLPADLTAAYGSYLDLQKSQGFPFSDYAGQIICRTTYRITNYPGGRTDAQINLLQYEDTVIAGDVMLLGVNGGQFPLTYPDH